MRNIRNNQGFTLIEMIGVLAVIAILVALLLPKVFEIMAESRANALVAAVRTYETAIVDYYSDIGSLLPLDVGGTPTSEATGDSATAISLPARLTLDAADGLNTGANGWANFRGPYLAKFVSAVPPGLGTGVFMPAVNNPVAYGTATSATNIGFDLNNDGDSDIPTSSNTVYVSFTGIDAAAFENIDAIIDPGMGTGADRALRGRVKYDAATSTLMIYLNHG